MTGEVRGARAVRAAGAGVYVVFTVKRVICYVSRCVALASRHARAGYICVRASLHKTVECRSSPPLS